MSRRTAIFLVLLSAIGFGSMALFAHRAYDGGVTPSVLLTLRFAFAAALLAPVVWLRRLPLPRGGALAGFVLMGLLYTGQSQCYFTALMHASSGLVALLLYAYPVMVALLAISFGWEKLDRRTLLLMALAVAGIAITLGGKLEGDSLGILLGLLGPAIYAVYISIGNKVTQDTDPLSAALVVMTVTALGNGALALGSGDALPQTAATWWAIFAIGVCSVIAVATFLIGVKHLGGAQASIFSTLEPVVTILLGVLFLGESVSTGQLLGGAMVLVAVILLAQKPQVREVGVKVEASANQ
jgi:drug/metabolite transporter (DMT)-like permease